MKNPIYIVSGIKDVNIYSDPVQVIGWFPTYEDAYNSVKIGCGGIADEFIYMLIESYKPGFYSLGVQECWFSLDENSKEFVKSSNPVEYKGIINIGFS